MPKNTDIFGSFFISNAAASEGILESEPVNMPSMTVGFNPIYKLMVTIEPNIIKRNSIARIFNFNPSVFVVSKKPLFIINVIKTAFKNPKILLLHLFLP